MQSEDFLILFKIFLDLEFGKNILLGFVGFVIWDFYSHALNV